MEQQFIIREPAIGDAFDKWWDSNYLRFMDVMKAVKEEIPPTFDPQIQVQRDKGAGIAYISIDVRGRLKGSGKREDIVRENLLRIVKYGVATHDTYEEAQVHVFSKDKKASVIEGDPLATRSEYTEFLFALVSTTLEQAELRVSFGESSGK